MKYRGTIAYRTGIGAHIPEGFLASVVPAWDFLIHQHTVDDLVIEAKNKLVYPRFHFMRGMSCMLHDSANQIADAFEGDWVLFLDTDHVFSSDTFYEMVKTFEDNQLDILAGFTQRRQPPYLPVIQKTDFDPLKRFEPIIPTGLDRHQVIPIDATGLACTMIHRRVFQAIQSIGEKPFDFRSKFRPFKITKPAPGIYHDYQERYGLSLLPKDRREDEFYWEDISFFWRAALLGFKAWCAPWIKFHHIETRLVTEDLMQIPNEVEP